LPAARDRGRPADVAQMLGDSRPAASPRRGCSLAQDRNVTIAAESLAGFAFVAG
jgi:hypothetical protein